MYTTSRHNVSVRPELESMAEYLPGESLEAFSARTGIPIHCIIKLNRMKALMVLVLQSSKPWAIAQTITTIPIVMRLCGVSRFQLTQDLRGPILS